MRGTNQLEGTLVKCDKSLVPCKYTDLLLVVIVRVYTHRRELRLFVQR